MRSFDLITNAIKIEIFMLILIEFTDDKLIIFVNMTESIFIIPEIDSIMMEHLYLIDYSKLIQVNHYYHSLVNGNPLYLEYKQLCEYYHELRRKKTMSAPDIKEYSILYGITACQNKFWLMAKYFMSKYDMYIYHNNNEVFRWCCNNGNLEMASDLYLKSVKNGKPFDIHLDNEGAFRYASFHGHINVVKYLLALDDKTNIFASDDYALVKSCVNGHLEMTKYLYQLYLEKNVSRDRLIRIIADITSEYRNEKYHLEIIKWIHSLGFIDNNHLFIKISLRHNVDAIKWLLMSEPNIIDHIKSTNSWFYLFIRDAADTLEIMKYIYLLNPLSVANNIDIFKLICRNGFFSTLEWYISLNPDIVHHFDADEWNELCERMNDYHHSFTATKYFIFLRPELICQLSDNVWHKVFRRACVNDNLEDVQIIIETRHQIPEEIFCVCCSYESFKIMKWIYSLNPKLLSSMSDYMTICMFKNVCDKNNLEILSWLYSLDETKGKLILNSGELIEHCCKNDLPDVAEWLSSINNMKINTVCLNQLFISNVKIRNLRILKVLYKLNPQIAILEHRDSFEKIVQKLCLDIRTKETDISKKSLEILEWLISLNDIYVPITIDGEFIGISIYFK